MKHDYEFGYRGNYGPDMDPECVELCDILNSIQGVQTTESCFGHGKEDFLIFFKCVDWMALSFIGRCLDVRYGAPSSARVELSNSDVNQGFAEFLLVVEHGKDLEKDVKALCDSFKASLNNEAYRAAFVPDLAINVRI